MMHYHRPASQHFRKGCRSWAGQKDATCGWTFALLPSIVSFRPNVLGRWSVHLRPWHTLPIGKSQRSLLQVRLSSLDASCAALSILTIFSFDQVVMPIVVRLCFAASRPVATERPLLAIASRDSCICVEGRARQVSFTRAAPEITPCSAGLISFFALVPRYWSDP
jgi:hypothetical protein